MTVSMKRIFLCIIGLLGGLASWAAVESVIIYQAKFPSYLFFGLALGIIVGILMGGFQGSSEGIFLADRSVIIRGVITGAAAGIAGGAAGFLIGQALLFAAGNSLLQSPGNIYTEILPAARALGWAVMGIFIGMAEGIRSLSFNKIKVGFLGGLLGGIIGGLAVEFLPRVFNNLLISRLAGFLIFGLLIGFFYSLLEKSFSSGVLRLLNGSFKGKEFLLNRRRIRIGTSAGSDIRLTGYDSVEPDHADVISRGIYVRIKKRAAGALLKVNDDAVDNKELELEDVLVIGSAKFLFRYS